MADVAALTGNQAYINALDKIWMNVVGKKLYLTGGIGSTGAWEGFGPDYELPNSAYAETCASIANAFWNYRMFLLKADARYIDVLERASYNALLSGLSLSGDRFFYPNPLLSVGQYERSPWFACACCPSNIPRFVLGFPGYSYATSGNRVFLNLYVSGRARVPMAGENLVLEQITNYPWDGDVRVKVSPAKAGRFSLMLRIPGWARQSPVPSDLYRQLGMPVPADAVTLKVNGQEVPLTDTPPPRAFFRVEGDSFARRMAATAHARAAATPDLRPTPSRQDWRHRTSSARTRQSLRALWCLSLLMPHGLWRVAGRSISRTERGPRVVGLTLLLGLASPAHLLRRLLPSGADRWHWRASSLSIQHLRGRTSWIIVSAKNAPAPGAVYRRTRSMHSRMCSR